MNKQTEQYQIDQKTLDQIGDETIYRQLAMRMMKNMPLAMLKRIVPLKKTRKQGMVTFKIQIEG